MKHCTNCGTQLHDDTMVCPQCQTEFNSQSSSIPPEELSSKPTKSNNKNKAYICSIIVGIILILVGLFIQIPGGVLTTWGYLDGEEAFGYEFDDKYASIDEYVGGDAYNYIIGASLVAGKISGTMTTKAIFVVGGILCICLGITLLSLTRKEDNKNI